MCSVRPSCQQRQEGQQLHQLFVFYIHALPATFPTPARTSHYSIFAIYSMEIMHWKHPSGRFYAEGMPLNRHLHHHARPRPRARAGPY